MAAAVQLGARRHEGALHQEHRSSADRVGGMEPLLAFAPRADAVALLTEATAAWLGAELGAGRARARGDAQPAAGRPRSRARPSTRRRSWRPGGSCAEKQFIHLVRAFGEVAESRPGWRLRILGEGPLRGELIAHVAKVGLADRVELPGAVSDMAAEWAAARSARCPRSTEGFPLVAQEAMSAGVPVVTYDCPSGPRELVEHGVSGLLVGAGREGRARRRAARGSPATGTAARASARAPSRPPGSYDADTIAARVGTLFARSRDARPASGDRAGPRWDRPHTRERDPVAAPLVTPVEARAEAFGLASTRRSAAGPGWFVIPTHDRAGADRGRARVPAGPRSSPRCRRARPFLAARPRRPRLARTPPAAVAAMVDLQRRAMTPGSCSSPGLAATGPALVPRRGRVASRSSSGTGAATATSSRRAPTVDAASRVGSPDATVAGGSGVEVPSCTLMADRPSTTSRSRSTSSTPGSTATTRPGTPLASERLAEVGGDAQGERPAGQARFRSRDELRYSLRSLHLFAPWVRTHLPGHRRSAAGLAGRPPADPRRRPPRHPARPTRCRPSTRRPSRPRCTASPAWPSTSSTSTTTSSSAARPAPSCSSPPAATSAAFVGDGPSACPAPPTSRSCRRRQQPAAAARGRVRRRDHPRDGALASPAAGLGAARDRGPLPLGRRGHRAGTVPRRRPTSRCCPTSPSTTA